MPISKNSALSIFVGLNLLISPYASAQPALSKTSKKDPVKSTQAS